ncbi:MAG: hypothetical protein KF817_07515 [Phycisphaeraceae bacterium]|nr:hypothetical protein [Phycisphaeraceae bacterium]
MRPRRDQVDHSVVSTCHCTSRCVRRASLLARSEEVLLARKPWIEARLRHLVSIFAIELDTFCIMDNHLHLVLTIRPDIVASWSDEEVAERWLRYLPPKKRGVEREATLEDIQSLAGNSARVASCRLRLCQLGEFHKAVEQPLAWLANREEKITGHFWEGRYKSRRVLDPAALLSTIAYVDLNPVRAGLVRTPEQSEFTGVQHRIGARSDALLELSPREHSRAGTRAKCLLEGQQGCIAFPQEPVPAFLTPIADTPERRGLFKDLTLDEYLVVVDRIGRKVQQSPQGPRGAIPHDLAPILSRIELDEESFLSQMASTATWIGSVVGTAASCVREARRVNLKWVVSTLDLDQPAPGQTGDRATASR